MSSETSTAKVWIAGLWSEAITPILGASTFSATNPATGETLPGVYPVSTWADCDRALTAAAHATVLLRKLPGAAIADFLEHYAVEIEAAADGLVAMAHAETGLPEKPRLRDVELPRTTTQLRQAAAAAREGSWQQTVIDTKANIRSFYAPIGPVAVFGPNNFPFAFNSVAGGDFAAAIATGCPVLAKAHPLHPGTSLLLAKSADRALTKTGLPAGTVQMLYSLSNDDGLRLVADSRLAASSFTGSRTGGLALKKAADAAGKLFYAEMSSLNPIILLPGALAERAEKLATEIADSALAASGQFCTSPNLLFAVASDHTEVLAASLTEIYKSRPCAPLLSHGGLKGLAHSVHTLTQAGATVVVGGQAVDGEGARFENTLLRVAGDRFLAEPAALQTEAFGNVTALVTFASIDELEIALAHLEGNLTGSIYSATTGTDDALYSSIADLLRPVVGRLLNDKMPTGVALSPAMNHGGPYPSTAHPTFTAVGIPRSLLRFGALQCFDNVRQDRLPAALQDAPPQGTWRCIDGTWTRG